MFIRKQRIKNSYLDSNVFACDETPMWLDPIGKRCIEKRGARDLTVQTLGHEKLHLTVIPCACTNSVKCKPYALLNRKRLAPAIVQKFSAVLSCLGLAKSGGTMV